MWFQRKIKNRRLEREGVLDVKVRASQARRLRGRGAAIALGVAFASLFGAYLLWRTGEGLLNVLLYDNKAFALRELDIQTDGVIALDQLRRWAAVRPDANLLALDLARVKRDLELVPVIESVSVERILPHTLRIRIVEREPIAQINVPRQSSTGSVDMAVYHLDPEGTVIVPLDPRQRATPINQPSEQLPLLTGIKPQELKPGRRLEAPEIQAALQLVVCFSRSPMIGLADLKRIDVSVPDALVVTTGQGGEITFGLTDLDQQIRRWRQIVDFAQKQGKAVATLDLAISNNVPARWLEASAVPTAPPKLPKPLRYKKKSVNQPRAERIPSRWTALLRLEPARSVEPPLCLLAFSDQLQNKHV